MPDELVFYTNPMSRGRIARWMLEETGQPYRTELLDYPAMKQPAYLAINPMGKVPALAHGGTIITETAAICAYLADAFPATGLAPNPQSSARGVYYRWMFYGAGPAEAAIINKALGFEVPPPARGHGRLRHVRRRHGYARAPGEPPDVHARRAFSVRSTSTWAPRSAGALLSAPSTNAPPSSATGRA